MCEGKIELNIIHKIKALEYLKTLPDNVIPLTITSPPYNIGEKHHTSTKSFKAYDEYRDDLPESDYQEDQINVLNELHRCTKEGGSLFYNHKNRIKNGYQITPYEWLLRTNWKIKQELVWQNGTPNMDNIRFYPSTERIYWLVKGEEKTFINIPKSNDLFKDLPVGTEKLHKRAFPLKLAQRFIVCFPSVEFVFDPYMGSATTAIAAIKENKKYLGTEISEQYIKEGLKRIEIEFAQTKMFY